MHSILIDLIQKITSEVVLQGMIKRDDLTKHLNKNEKGLVKVVMMKLLKLNIKVERGLCQIDMGDTKIRKKSKVDIQGDKNEEVVIVVAKKRKKQGLCQRKVTGIDMIIQKREEEVNTGRDIRIKENGEDILMKTMNFRDEEERVINLGMIL